MSDTISDGPSSSILDPVFLTPAHPQSISSSTPSIQSTPGQPLKKRRRLRAQETWDYFRPAEGPEAIFQNDQRLWYCKRCRDPVFSTTVTTTARRHYLRTHGIDIGQPELAQAQARQRSIEVAFSQAKNKQLARVEQNQEAILRSVVNPTAFYEAQIQLITRRRLPYNCVNWPEYQALLIAVNYTCEDLLIQSGNTITAHIDRSFQLHRETIKARLQSARSQIHISIDLWSSPNRKAFLGICAQWVDENYQLRQALLGLPNVRHSHSGEVQSKHLLSTIQYFDITSNLGYVTTDNGSSNDTCLRALSDSLQALDIEFDPVLRHIRCGGHIINLCLDAFLFAKSQEALKAAIDEAFTDQNISVAQALQAQLGFKSKGKGKGKGKASQAQS